MPLLATLVVAYAGIGGAGASKVDAQVRAVVEAETEVADAELTDDERASLVARGDDAAEIVQRLDVTGVIAGELKKTKQGTTLIIVVYGHDGAMIDLVDLGVGTKKKKVGKLAKDDLDTVRELLVPDVQQLIQAEQDALEAAKLAEAARAEAEAEEARTADAESPALEGTETTGRGGERAGRRSPKLRVHLGVGPRSRDFSTEVTGLRGYDSTPVPAARLAVEVAPIRYLAIELEGERTLTMNSTIADMEAATSIMHWQASAALRLPLGPVELAAIGGVGGRDFDIEAAGAPTPDNHYIYAVAGARLGVHLGGRIELRVGGAFQPVIGGDEQDTMATLGAATRSGFEVGGGLLVAATDHIYVAGEASFQRFSWTWDTGTATDTYPSGTLSIGASY